MRKGFMARVLLGSRWVDLGFLVDRLCGRRREVQKGCGDLVSGW